ncbi:MAG: class I SAM-dependent methyltransferase [Candidatus Dormiibacterota bacterium]
MSEQDYVRRNRAAWDEYATEYVEAGREAWGSPEPWWGIWRVPESELHVLPDVRGLDSVELGCGTGYVSAWLARRGARPVGIDNSRAQLASARKFQREFGIDFALVQADAERAPFASESFDLAISEYGACLWCDPYRWIPEAARLLRRGGELIFLSHSALVLLCMPDLEADGPAGNVLIRDHFGMHRFDWSDYPSTEFHLGHGDLVRLFRKSGFEIEDMIEVRPPEGSSTRHPFVTLEWARRWPCEEIWKARKAGA